MRPIRSGAWSVLLIVGALGGCTIGEPGPMPGDSSGELDDAIQIEHPVHQIGLAQMKADNHCGARGKRAIRVQTTPSQTSAVLLQTSVTTFACVQ